MESAGDSSSLGGLKGKGKKTDRHRRAWTPVEESILADLMKELVANGWRSENGFKPGYLAKLEMGMRDRIPGTDIRQNPHINSRLTIWKKFHGSLHTMLTQNSGIGFNSSTCMIECHDDAWNLIVKADPNATHMRYKTWPLYYDWNEIFGTDKANGGTAEDVREAVNEFETEQRDRQPDGEFFNAGSTNDGPVDMDVNSETPHIDIRGKSKCTSKRRSGEAPGDKICDVLEKMNKSADIRMDKLVSVMGKESTLTVARKELFNIVDELPDLNDDEKVDAAHILAKHPECLEMFMGMGITNRSRYVRRLLGGHLTV